MPNPLVTDTHAAWSKFNAPLQAVGWIAIAGIVSSAAMVLAAPSPSIALVSVTASTTTTAPTEIPPATHVEMPAQVRGLYMTSYTAASPKGRHGIFEYAKRNDLNAVVIDIKDFGGSLAFTPHTASLMADAPKSPTIPDLPAVLDEAHAYGLYVIARQFVFQDPRYAQAHPDQAVLNGNKVWTDYKGVSWVDPAAKANWAYNAQVAEDAYESGFDEIQLDYIRFPSDGKLSAISYAKWDGKTPKQQIIGDFYRYMHAQLAARGIPLSLDLFGYVTWYRDFDLGIGQLIANGLPNATAISAMVYPSHYGPGALGFANPAEHPYDIVNTSLAKANLFISDIKKGCSTGAMAYVVSGSGTPSQVSVPCAAPLAGERPWLQAFDLGAVYTKDMINAQIKAANDQDASGWLLWNARNVYRDIK